MPIRAEHRRFYQTPEWKAARERVIERAENKCEWCFRPNGMKVLTADDETGRWFDDELAKWVMPRLMTPLVTIFGPGPIPAPNCATRRLVQLGVAHLDHIPGHDEDSNLAALCRRCHLLYDAKHHYTTARLRRDERSGQLRFELEGVA